MSRVDLAPEVVAELRRKSEAMVTARGIDLQEARQIVWSAYLASQAASPDPPPPPEPAEPALPPEKAAPPAPEPTSSPAPDWHDTDPTRPRRGPWRQGERERGKSGLQDVLQAINSKATTRSFRA